MNNDGTIEFGQSFIYDENGNVFEDAVILNYVAKDEAEEEEFEKMFKQLEEVMKKCDNLSLEIKTQKIHYKKQYTEKILELIKFTLIFFLSLIYF